MSRYLIFATITAFSASAVKLDVDSARSAYDVIWNYDEDQSKDLDYDEIEKWIVENSDRSQRKYWAEMGLKTKKDVVNAFFDEWDHDGNGRITEAESMM